MPNWKKVIVSGSDARINSLFTSGHVTASGNISGSSTSTGSFGYVSISGSITGSATSTASFGSLLVGGAEVGGHPVIAADSILNSDHFITFVDNSGDGSTPQQLKTDTSLKYNPNSNLLTTTTTNANIAAQVTLATETLNNDRYVIFGNGAGDVDLKIDSGIRYNPSTNLLSTTVTNANIAAQVTLATETLNNDRYVTFGSGAGDVDLKIDSGIRYNPSTNLLSTTVTNANIAEQVTLSTETLNNDRYVIFGSGVGDMDLHIDSGIRYNPSTNLLTTTVTNANIAEQVTLSTETLNNERYVTFGSGAGDVDLHIDSGIRYNPNSNLLTTTVTNANIAAQVTLSTESLNNERYVIFGSGAGDVDLHIDSGIRYNPNSNLLTTDVVGDLTGNADTATTATTATKVVITDNESTNEDNAIVFVAGADIDGSTSVGLESDGDLKYNPSTGKLTSTKFVGDGSELTNLPAPAVVTYNDAANNRILTSVDSTSIKGEDALLFDGTTLTVTGDLAVDNVVIDGSTIGHTNDSDLMTLSSGKLVIAGDLEIQGTTTTVNSTEVSIADRILTLNANSATGDGGIYVNDADTAETGSLLWDVSEDRWIGGLKDNEVKLVTLDSTDTLTNKTLTAPVIATIVPASGQTLTLPSTTGTLARTSDNVASATVLETARNIGGVSFNGSANIDLPGVNTAGTQDTSGTATNADHVKVTDNENTNEENLITFVENGHDSTGNYGLEMDGQLTYNPSTGTLSSTVFSGNLSGTATNANHILVTDNENANENNLITFVENAQDGSGNHGLEMDGQLYYNPSSGTVTATGFAGNLSGNATTATQLANSRNIGGVSFNGGADINLPGVNTAGTQDTSGNAATATKISSINNGDIVQLTTTQTLSGKTLTSPILNTGISGTAIKDEDDLVSDSATHLATQQSIKAYVDASVTAQDLDLTSDSGTIAIDLDSQTLDIAGGTGIDTTATGTTLTVDIDSTVATLSGNQTLTNKSLTNPTVTGTLNVGASILYEGSTENDHSINLSATDPTGTRVILLPDVTGTVSLVGATETLVNKTLTTPNIGTPSAGVLTNTTGYPGDSSLVTVGTIGTGTWNGSVIASAYLDSDTAHLTTNQTFTGNKTFSAPITGSHFSGSLISTGSFGHVHITDGVSGLGIGDDNDLLLYHNGNHSYIKDNGTGNLYIQGGTQTFQNAAASKTMMILNAANSVDLYYDNSKKFETTNAGVSVTGDMSVSGKLTAQEFHTTVTSASIIFSDGSNQFGNSMDDIHTFSGSLVVTGSITGSIETSASFGNIFVSDNIEAIGTGSFRTLNVVNTIESEGRVSAPGFTSTANNIFVDTTVTGILRVVGNITGSDISGSATGTGSFGTIKVDDTTKVDNLNADLLDGQTGTYYTDFSNMAVSDDEIPIAKLASDSVSYGGVEVTLGTTDDTPAFNLSDATAYVGDSSLVTTGTITTGVWNSSFGAVSNGLISGSWKGNNAIDISADTNLAASTGITLTGDTLTTNDSAIVHDDLSGFVANEHINHTAVDITAGNGLTGGGDISTTRTLNVVGGTGITANADNITTNDSEIVHDDLSGFVANEHIDHSGVSITAGTGLTGGGTIESTRTLNVVGGTGITANADDIAIDFGDSTLQTTISGSFTEASGGFSTRITNTELSASHSSSVATRLTDLEDNTNDVTLGGSLDYLTITNQVITRNAIDLSSDVTGTLPLSGTGLVAGTNITLDTNTLNVDDAFLVNNADDSTSGKITAGGFITSGHVTASLGVSGSVSSTGSFGRIEPAGNLVPKIHNTSDLGSADKRWANIYSQDLQLSNENANGNEVDGTTGSWTIQEGSDDLYLLNRKNGKKYRFKLEEIT